MLVDEMATTSPLTLSETACVVEHCEEAGESQSMLRSMGAPALPPPPPPALGLLPLLPRSGCCEWWIGDGLFGMKLLLVFIICSSCCCARRNAVCIAITRWRSEVSLHFSHLQERNLQKRLWLFSGIFNRWFRQRAQFGGVRRDAEVDEAFTTAIFESYSDCESDIFSLLFSNTWYDQCHNVYFSRVVLSHFPNAHTWRWIMITEATATGTNLYTRNTQCEMQTAHIHTRSKV